MPNSDYQPKTAVSEEEWMPSSARIPVSEHSRARPQRKPPEGSLEAQGLAGARAVREQALGRAGAVLPGLGGFAGGVAGGIPGATIGGMIGKAAQLGVPGLKAASGIRPSKAEAQIETSEALRQIARAGVEQGLLQTGGTAAVKVLGATGKLAMRAALKADPRVAQTAITEGITATKAGLRKLGQKIAESGAVTTNLISQATRSGKIFSPVQMAREIFQELGPVASNRAVPIPAQTAVQDLTRALIKGNPGDKITPDKLQAIKRTSDAALERYYSKLAPGRPRPDPSKLPIQLQWHKAVADKARTLLETIPGVATQNARTSSLLELQGRMAPALSDRLMVRLALQGARPAAGALAGAMVPGDRGRNAAIGAVAGTAATSPALLSQLALMANNPMLAQLLRNAPNALSMLATEPEPAAP